MPQNSGRRLSASEQSVKRKSEESFGRDGGRARSTEGSDGRPSKKPRPVAQACQRCRSNKVKCDGRRPSCTSCVEKGRPCTYVGEAGESRQAAMKARLQALEGLLKALQAVPSEEADRMLGRLRSGRDPAWPLSSGSEPRSSESSDSSEVQVNTPQSFTSASTSSAPTSIPTADILRIVKDHYLASHEGSHPGSDGALSPSAASSTSSSQDGVARILYSLVVPRAEVTRAALDNFYKTSGRLFWVFHRSEIDEYYKTVFYGGNTQPEAAKKLAVCSVSIVAAVGVQYHPHNFEPGKDEEFYSIARHFFTDVIEHYPMEAIKICTMLAMYNVMNKALIALGYVEVALSMCRIHNLNNKLPRPYTLPNASAADYRKTWRTLIFFSGWLSFTLGYISGADTFVKVVPSIELEPDNDSGIVDMVQAEMTRISLLTANILKTHLASHDLTRMALEAIVKELKDWHSRLPREMLLANLSRRDIPDNIRVSIFHLHLLYLGAYTLLYRRIASRYFDALDAPFEDGSDSKSIQDLILVNIEQGLQAARHSARILGLLLEEKFIARRCWIIIFQCNTACTVLLHTILQSQLHQVSLADFGGDLDLAHRCLEVLKYCSSFDVVALGFYERLSPIYVALSRHAFNLTPHVDIHPPTVPPDLSPPHLDETTSVSVDSKSYLLKSAPQMDAEQTKLSLRLLHLLCRPYGERNSTSALNMPAALNASKTSEPLAGADPPPMPEGRPTLCRAGWTIESSQVVRWEETRSAIGPWAKNFSVPEKSLFLGSEEPSGWAPLEGFEGEEIAA